MTHKTGWPAGLLQDDSRELSRWFASRPEARRQARDLAHQIKERNMNDKMKALLDSLDANVPDGSWVCPNFDGRTVKNILRAALASRTQEGA